MHGFVREVLAEKGDQVLSVPVGATVRDAVHHMNASGVGALVVLQLDDLVGVFSERDVLRRVVDAGRDPDRTRVSEVMSSPVLTIDYDTRMTDAMSMMTKHRVRHLPVVHEGRLVGMISIGDLLRRATMTLEAEVASMADYITGRS